MFAPGWRKYFEANNQQKLSFSKVRKITKISELYMYTKANCFQWKIIDSEVKKDEFRFSPKISRTLIVKSCRYHRRVAVRENEKYKFCDLNEIVMKVIYVLIAPHYSQFTHAFSSTKKQHSKSRPNTANRIFDTLGLPGFTAYVYMSKSRVPI